MANQVMRITLKAYDHQLVDASAAKIIETVKKNGAMVSGPVPLPTKKEVVTILRAVHKYKDSREQFEPTDQEKGETHTAAVFSLWGFADRQTVFVHRILPDSAFAQCLSFSFHALRLYAQDKALPLPCFLVLLQNMRRLPLLSFP